MSSFNKDKTQFHLQSIGKLFKMKMVDRMLRCAACKHQPIPCWNRCAAHGESYGSLPEKFGEHVLAVHIPCAHIKQSTPNRLANWSLLHFVENLVLLSSTSYNSGGYSIVIFQNVRHSAQTWSSFL